MTTMESINSYATLNIEYELPFYLRSTGSYKGDLSVNYPEGYLRHYICIILEGKCFLNVDTFSYHLKSGDGFFVRAHCPFKYHNLTKNCRVQWLTFDGYATIPLFSRLGLENFMIYHKLNCHELSYDLSRMYYIAVNDDITSKLNNSALTYKFLIDIYTQSEQGIKSSEDSFTNNAFLYAKRYIDQFYMKELTQPEIANAAGITPQHLCRLFQKNMHTTPIRYLNEIRITEAKRLLSKTSLSIVCIGGKVGYQTPHYFSSMFRKITGQTPSSYREIMRIAKSN